MKAAESACILIAEIVDLYRQSVLMSNILGLLNGSFNGVAAEDYKKIRQFVTL
jgi:hypothetical protein